MAAEDHRNAGYVHDVTAAVEASVKQYGCQPILFVGSGISKRYFGGPSWDELLIHLAEHCPLIDRDYGYYRQLGHKPPEIGEAFAKKYHEWAWSTGRKHFPDSLFEENIPLEAFIKFRAAEYLESITPKSIGGIKNPEHLKELEALQRIKPHAIITTNYDRFLESVFPDYTPVIGQKIITGANLSVGEIFKIHGCVSDPSGIVLTKADYAHFNRKKKYLSAKLLTYFSEHPLLFLGYSAEDPDIRAILSDIDEALPSPGGVVDNIYFLEWMGNRAVTAVPAREKLIEIADSHSVRVNAVQTNGFEWVFRAFSNPNPLGVLPPRTLRALLSRCYELVRHNRPRATIAVDYQTLEHAVETGESFAQLLGITTIDDPSVISAQYPYTLSDLAAKLKGLKKAHWSHAQKEIDAIKRESGIDIKASDNRYHCAVRYGKAEVHKYSDAALDLLRKSKQGKPYSVESNGSS